MTVVGQGRVATTRSAPVGRAAAARGRSPTTTSTSLRRRDAPASYPTTTEQWTLNNGNSSRGSSAEVSDLILIGDTLDYIALLDVGNAICRVDSILI